MHQNKYMNKFKLILLNNIICTALISQIYVPPQFPGVSDLYYKSNAPFLRSIKSVDSIQINYIAWNIISSYINIKAPSDTVLVYTKKVFDRFPYETCYDITNDMNRLKNFYKQFFGRNYENSLRYICKFCDSIELTYNQNLIQFIDSIYTADEKDRKIHDHLLSIKTNNQISDQQFGKKIYKNDSIRSELIDSIINLYNYPGYTIVGCKNSYKTSSLILHFPYLKMKKLYPSVAKAVQNRQLSPYHLAFLQDRLLWLEEKKQIYGTQYKILKNKVYIFPVEDPKGLDKRRNSVNMLPIKKEIKELEKELSQKDYKVKK